MRRRQNMADRVEEKWRPPLFTPMRNRRQRAAAVIRRFFDLQAGSLWKDLKGELAEVRGKVLDVGCGAQPYRSLLPPEAVYIGIDTADAREHFGYAMPDTLYYSGDVWPVEEGSIDVILCTETLEHVLEPRRFLAEASRCLRAGGRLFLTVPFAARWHFIPYDYWRYTPSGLKYLLVESGFENIGVYARGNATTVACYKAIALLLPLFLPQSGRSLTVWTLRLLGLPTLPFFILFAVIANLSLKWDGGDDCLGYTVLAERQDHAAKRHT